MLGNKISWRASTVQRILGKFSPWRTSLSPNRTGMSPVIVRIAITGTTIQNYLARSSPIIEYLNFVLPSAGRFSCYKKT